MEREYSILTYGRVYNPQNWFYNPAYAVNRIYYIVGGSAYYKGTVRLRPGFLYVFGASADFRVSQSNDDPVDHVYFDFVTHQKLIAEDYIEIDPAKDGRLYHFLQALAQDFACGGQTGEWHLGAETGTAADDAHDARGTSVHAADDVRGVSVRTAEHYDSQGVSAHTAACCLEILLHYLEDVLLPVKVYSETTRQTFRLLHSLPVQELSVARIAAECNKNMNHIIRCFKSETGITPHRYIAGLKTDLAISYSRQGLSCTEIAEKLGFGSLAAFSYFFKSETGRNLSDFRRA